jgi:hypothetical protein
MKISAKVVIIIIIIISTVRILTSEFTHLWIFGTIPWTGDQPKARLLHTQDNTT